MFDLDFERRVEAAARVIGIDPAEFIARAVRRRCAEVLGEVDTGRASVADAIDSGDRPAAKRDAHGGQVFDQRTIRPTPTRVLRTIATASRACR